MPVRYDQDTKDKAIRLVREHAGDYRRSTGRSLRSRGGWG
jgi:hypothetical protein